MAEYTDDQLKELVGKAVSDATSTANGEAAGFRVELKKLKDATEKRDADDLLAKNKRAEEQGEFQDLYQGSQKTLGELQTEHDRLVADNQNYQERDKKALETLLESVPDEFKKLITDDLPLSKRLEMAQTFATVKPAAPEARLPGQPDNALTITRQGFDALSPAAKSKHISGGGQVTD